MKRTVSSTLNRWLAAPDRAPLVLRGARQVGKTWLVRDLATRHGLDLVELNFERDPELRHHFHGNDPAAILNELALAFGRELRPDRSLLFLDEIQAAGELLAKLRWFREEMPGLPVVAAGSLLEFTLADHSFSMPVGRITFRQVDPMSFPEYLEAHGQRALLETLGSWRPGDDPSPAAHQAASAWFHRYAMVGGMPAVVAADVTGREARDCRDLQKDLLATYRADFPKYEGRMAGDALGTVLTTVAASIGRKFVHARTGLNTAPAKRALQRLVHARLCTPIRHTAANGLPLGAEAKDSFRKVALLDVGLLHALLGTPAAAEHPSRQALAPELRARIAEQLAAQQLRLRGTGAGDPPDLFYWQREGSHAGEIDHLVEVHGRIVPIELKSGAAGAMKSLHQFAFDKGLGLAVRCDTNPPGVQDIAVRTTRRDPVRYRLVSLPHHLLWNLDEILAGEVGAG